ncbi:hypothetical protein GPL15_20130 [Clostridium sp. MCC353]|uniref:ABC transporter permease n=1 Tax=Clostridium sp. MCC353 TaxID=2592646 RepID=UPI001C02EFBB|nr:ABC transporter permease [Clostridium sp. MCC353]MBT9778792.1 hypothetical protein [Clostridium sp. MCC353]
MRRWTAIMAAVIFLGIGLAAGFSLRGYSGQVFLHYPDGKGPDQKAIEKMEDGEKEAAEWKLPRFAAWRMEEGVEVKANTPGKKIIAECMTVYGEKGLAAPLPLYAGNFGSAKDKVGCVVSQGLAMELFGSGQVVGMELLCMDKTYKIRGVMKEKKNLVLLPSSGQPAFESLLFDYGEGESGKMEVQKLLFRYGIDSESLSADGALFFSGTMFFVYLAAASFFFCGIYEFGRQYRERDAMDVIPVFLIVFSAMVCFFLLSRGGASVPQEFIPTRWSDFDFWVNKYREIKGCLTQLFKLMDLYWPAFVVKRAAVGIGSSFLAVLAMTFR